MIPITSIKGIGPSSALLLKTNGFTSIKDIAEASVEQLQNVPGFGPVRAASIIEDAARLLAEQAPSPAPAPAPVIKKEGKKKGKKKKKDKKQTAKKKKDTKKSDTAKLSKKENKTKKGSGKKKKKK